MKPAILSLLAAAMLLSACGTMGMRRDQTASTYTTVDDAEPNAIERAQGQGDWDSAGPYWNR